MDCNGDCFGDAYEDDCGTCDNDAVNDCAQYSIGLDGIDLVSFYALPEDNGIENIFAGITDYDPGVLGEGYSANYINDIWMGALTSIEREDGYWIKISGETELVVEGVPTNPSIPYSLHYGSNLVSYPFAGYAPIEETIPLDVQSSFIGILGEGISAMNTENGWVGGLIELSGTEGYWFITSEAIDFTYNPPIEGFARERSPVKVIPSEYSFIQSRQQAFFFVDNATIGGEPIETEDLIIIYNGDVVIGARYWYGETTDVPAMGFDTDPIYAGYANAGDNITFKVLDASTNKLIDMIASNDIAWQNFGMSLIQLSDNVVPAEITLGNAYPNPFNPLTKISFGVPNKMEVQVVVYDMLGRLIIELIDDIYDQGYYEIQWNASEQASGIYFIKMVTADQTNFQKLMLVK
jgi:hypothetical protein